MLNIETERVYLREWVPDDWKRYKPLATDPRVLKYIGDGRPATDEQIRTRIDTWISSGRERGWILWPVIHREHAELIGFCGFWDGFAPDVEIGWRLLPEYWGQGIATEAATAVMEFGFKRWEFPKLISVAQTANAASIRIMEKLGMDFERSFLHGGTEVVCYSKVNPYLRNTGSGKLIVRPYLESDEQQVVQLWGAVFPNPPAWNVPAEDIRRKLSVQRDLFLVGEVAGRIVATTMAGFDGHRGWLHLVAVHPDYRKRGIGRELMLETERRIRKIGCTKVNLQVRASNQGVVEFYNRLGYSTEDRVSMGKRLE
jgi:RimJ/RimL family protein N-acetyltransferase